MVIDTTAPAAAITGPASPTNSDPFDVTIDFAETVTGFVQGDITVGNGSVTGFTDNGDGSFTATIDVTAEGIVTVDVAAGAAIDGAGNGNGAAAQFSVTYAAGQDQDQDGVSNDVENGAPNNGDGNKDGTADNQQNHVASFPNAVNGDYVTVAAPSGTTLHDVTATDNPSPSDAPAGVNFAVGFFDYVIEGVGVGGSAVVTVFPESGTVINTYYQYGPTPDDPTDHWYAFMHDGETGAIIHADHIELHFVDGKRGDDDLSENGQIVDPGAPGGTANLWQNPELPEDVNCDNDVTALDVLKLINDINSGRGPVLPATIQGSDTVPIYPDVSGEGELTALDVLQVVNYINAQPSGQPGGEGEAAIDRGVFAAQQTTDSHESSAYHVGWDSIPTYSAQSSNVLLVAAEPYGSHQTDSPDDVAAERQSDLKVGSPNEQSPDSWMPADDEPEATWAELEDVLSDLAADVTAAWYL